MKTTLYSVYLMALNGRFVLSTEETNERHLLAHYFGRNIAVYGFMTKEKLYSEVNNCKNTATTAFFGKNTGK